MVNNLNQEQKKIPIPQTKTKICMVIKREKKNSLKDIEKVSRNHTMLNVGAINYGLSLSGEST